MTDAIERRGFFGVLAGAVFAPYVCRNSGFLMPIADRSLIAYEVRGEKLAENGGPLPDPDWLQTMQFHVPRRWVDLETPKKLLEDAKWARPDVYWSGVIILS